MNRRILTSPALLLLSALVLSAPQLACTQLPVPTETRPVAGTLHGTISVQVTASENKKAMVVDSADLAELLSTRVRSNLQKSGFELRREEAEQHVIVHVADAKRGSGSINSSCKLEVYVYSSWPGTLAPRKNRGQVPDGSVPGAVPLLHKSLELKDQRRLRIGANSKLRAGADYFAELLAVELASLRDNAAQTVDSPSEGARLKAPSAIAEEAQPVPAAFQVAFSLRQGPGNLTLTPAGRLFVSLHQFFDPPYPVAEVSVAGTMQEFAQEARLDSVLGLQSDENGVVWMLDNGMKSSHRPRLVGWHSVRNKLVADIDLTQVAPDNAFFNDLVIDLDHRHAYLAEPAGGENAALVLVNLETKVARRVLEGHKSVVPEDIDLLVEGVAVEIKLADGSVTRPRVGVNPIAADADNTWLYFGPMHGTSLYRIRTADLRNESLSNGQLEEKVERFAKKPICDGISIDRTGNIYLGALENNAIWKIGPDGTAEVIAEDPRLSWVDAFSFGPDGKLYAVANQLHLSAPLHRGKNLTKAPYLIVSLPTKAAGIVGR